MLVPFLPPPGLNSDDTTFSAEGRWADGNNVRFRGGKPETIGGSITQFSTAAGGASLVGPIRDVFAFERSGAATFVYGVADSAPAPLFVGTGLVSPTNRAGASGPAATTGWSFDAWGSILLAAPYGGTLWEQSGTSDIAEVTNAPNRIDAGILVTNERQVLAFGTNEEASGTFNPLCIRGSDIEDYTDWTTSSTNNAFEHILPGTGRIMARAQIGAYIAVWTTGELFIGQFVGDPGQAYRFDKVADQCGAMTTRSVAVMDGTAYWMGQDFQLRSWTPGGPVIVIPCPIRLEFETGAYRTDNQVTDGAFLVSNAAHKELWFHYKHRVDDLTNEYRYVAYSVSESAAAQRPVWFRGILSRTAALDSPLVRTLSTSRRTAVLAVDESENVMLHDCAETNFTTATHIQSADQYLDNSQRRMMVRSFIPDFEVQSGTVQLTLYVRDRPMSSATTKGPHSLAEGATKKDFRASGKIMAARLSVTNGRFRLGKPLFDMIPMGER